MSEDRSIRDIRLEKLAQLRELGADPFGAEKFKRDHPATKLVEDFESLEGQEVSFAGRIVAMRLMGKAAFAHMSDGEGRIQGYFKKDDVGEDAWAAFKLMDIGDHIGVTGTMNRTRTGEPTIFVTAFTPLSKAIQNLPLGKEKDGQQWNVLSDVEERYRHRHLDLMVNPES
mgnify:CR=1 FL=1